MQEWKAIGKLLIEGGILTPKTVARVLAVSRKHNKRFGWTLEKLGLVTGPELAEVLARQYGLKLLKGITRFNFPPELFELIPVDVAMQHQIFPLKREGNSLLIAVADPTEQHIVENLAANTGLEIKRCIATRSDIHAAICKYYLNRPMETPRYETVLVVDDEATALALTCEFIQRAGYQVLTAQNGLDAYKTMIAQRPQVVVTDKVMPLWDGFALLKSLQALPEFQTTPVLLMSDKLTPEQEMRLFEMGFFDYIPKPINRVTLVSRVKRAFRFNSQQYVYY